MKRIVTVLLIASLAFFLSGIVFSQDDEFKPKSKETLPGSLTSSDKAMLDWLYNMRLELKKGEKEGVSMAVCAPIKSAHYEVNCNSTPKVAKYYSDMMETLYTKYAKVFGAFSPDSKTSKVIIYGTRDEFQRQPGAGPNVGGFYQPRTRVLTTCHGKFGLTMDTASILAHEGTHQFQHLVIKGSQQQFFAVPIWLIEGMAVIFEAAEINVKDKKVTLRGVSNDRLVQMQQMIKAGQNKPLMTIIQTPQAQFQAAEYAHAGLLQYYMLFGGNKKIRDAYDKYLREAIEGAQKNKPVRPARFQILVEQATKASFAEFEDGWKKYVMSLTPSMYGRIVGDTYISDSHFFRFSSPSGAYKIQCSEQPAGGEVANVVRGDGEKVRVGVFVIEMQGNTDLKNYIDDMKAGKTVDFESSGRSKYQVFEEEGENFRQANGYDAFERFRKIQSAFSALNTGLQKVQTVMIMAYGRVYVFQIQCPYDKYGDYKQEFEKMLESFSPYLPEGMKK